MDAKISHTSTSASAKIFSHGSSAAGPYGIKIKSSLRLLPRRPCFVDFLILGQVVSLFPSAAVASIFAYIGLLGLESYVAYSSSGYWHFSEFCCLFLFEDMLYLMIIMTILL